MLGEIAMADRYFVVWTVKTEGVILPEERLPTGPTILVGLQHVVAMFGATVLAPILMGFDPNVAIFFSGIATLIFFAVTGGRIPSYLGSSFAFIGPVLVVTGAAVAAGPNPNLGRCARRHHRGGRALFHHRPHRDGGRARVGRADHAAGRHRRDRRGHRPRARADRDQLGLRHRSRQCGRLGLRALDRADHGGGGRALRGVRARPRGGASRSCSAPSRATSSTTSPPT